MQKQEGMEHIEGVQVALFLLVIQRHGERMERHETDI